MPEIIYSSKEKLYPLFDHAAQSKQVAYVREDLPNSGRKFVVRGLVEIITDPPEQQP